jgi:hypothetical protein
VKNLKSVKGDRPLLRDERSHPRASRADSIIGERKRGKKKKERKKKRKTTFDARGHALLYARRHVKPEIHVFPEFHAPPRFIDILFLPPVT